MVRVTTGWKIAMVLMTPLSWVLSAIMLVCLNIYMTFACRRLDIIGDLKRIWHGWMIESEIRATIVSTPSGSRVDTTKLEQEVTKRIELMFKEEA